MENKFNPEKAMERLAELMVQKHVIDVEIQGIRDDLSTDLSQRGAKYATGGGMKATYCPSYMREHFDLKRFQESYPDLYSEFVELRRHPRRLVIRSV